MQPVQNHLDDRKKNMELKMASAKISASKDDDDDTLYTVMRREESILSQTKKCFSQHFNISLKATWISNT